MRQRKRTDPPRLLPVFIVVSAASAFTFWTLILKVHRARHGELFSHVDGHRLLLVGPNFDAIPESLSKCVWAEQDGKHAEFEGDTVWATLAREDRNVQARGERLYRVKELVRESGGHLLRQVLHDDCLYTMLPEFVSEPETSLPIRFWVTGPEQKHSDVLSRVLNSFLSLIRYFDQILKNLLERAQAASPSTR